MNTKAPPDQRSLEKRLASLITLSISDQPLGRLFDDLRGMSGIRFEIDAKVDLERTVSIRADDISLKTALNRIATEAKLSLVVRNETVQVGPLLPADSHDRPQVLFNESERSGPARFTREAQITWIAEFDRN